MKKKFHNCLKNEHVINKDYEHAKRISNKFGKNTTGDYYNLYFKCFVISRHIWITWRNIYLEYYKLDSCHYFISLGVSWNEMVKMTDVTLDLFSEAGM